MHIRSHLVIDGLIAALVSVGMVATVRSDDEKIDYGGVIRAAPLPEGFSATVQEIRNVDAVSGQTITGKGVIVTSQARITDGIISGVIVLAEGFPRPTDGHKVAAVKGFINATNHVWNPRGFRLTEQNAPDPTFADFSKPYRARLIYEMKPIRLTIKHHVFFTNQAYDIIVTTQNRQDLLKLSHWAETVEAVSTTDP